MEKLPDTKHVHGIDYQETFAPTVRLESIRTVTALYAHHGWLVHHMDVSTAFLNGRSLALPTLGRRTELFAQVPMGRRVRSLGSKPLHASTPAGTSPGNT